MTLGDFLDKDGFYVFMTLVILAVIIGATWVRVAEVTHGHDKDESG